MKKLLPKSVRSSGGFTLIELLVVITIIAFLAVIGIASFTNAQKQARDGRRRADIEAIATALEANRTSGGKYPIVNCDSTTIFASSKCPTDPSTSAYYSGAASTTERDTYSVCATLEIPAGQTFCRSQQQ